MLDVYKRQFLDGQDVGQADDLTLSAIRCKKVGFVFQNFNLIPRTNALKNVELPMMHAGVPQRQRTEPVSYTHLMRRPFFSGSLKRLGIPGRFVFLRGKLGWGRSWRWSLSSGPGGRRRVGSAHPPAAGLRPAAGLPLGLQGEMCIRDGDRTQASSSGPDNPNIGPLPSDKLFSV